LEVVTQAVARENKRRRQNSSNDDVPDDQYHKIRWRIVCPMMEESLSARWAIIVGREIGSE